MKRISIQYYDSPCGEMVLGSIGEKLCLCDWKEGRCAKRNMSRLVRLYDTEFLEETTPILERVKTELDEYFSGERNAFDIPLCPAGTPFQKAVWEALLEIPYGELRTYKQVAQSVGNVCGVRAVAQAIGANGISIIIPCHRVVGSDGSLTGFAGGIEAKKILLQLEKAAIL